ncbi:MAG: MFS transporter, partial [Anaerolineae bacterium]|nr:MFS transporter [Anaerolineae bacterium]
MPKPPTSAEPPLLSGSFLWLNVAQFLGALNDNLFQLLMTFFVMDLAVFPTTERAMALAGAVFVLPFLLFSPLAGAMADRFSKGGIVRWMKVLEVVVMLAGLWAFAARSVWGIFAVLFLMALQSTLFSPSKYGIIPEIVPEHRLSRANGALTMFTYIAIIVGAAAAPAVALATGNHYVRAQWVCIAIALVGTAA